MPEKPEEVPNEGELETMLTDAAASGATPEPTPEPEPTTTPTPEPQPSALEIAKNLGIETDNYQSDEELLKGLYSQLQETKPYADYGRQVLPYDDQIRKIITQEPEPEPEKEPDKEWSPESYFSEKWQRPNYDKAWEAFISSGMVQLDPNTGQFVPAEGYQSSVPINVLQGLNEYKSWQRSAIEQLLENPYKGTWDAFQEPLQRMIQDQIDQHLSQFEQTQNVSNWEAQHADVLYEHDTNGQIVLDIYGRPKPSEYGEKFIAAATKLHNGGMHDPNLVIECALEIVGQPPAAEQQAETPEQVSEQKQRSFIDEAREKASHSPSAGGYSENNDIEPIVQSTRELDNMFIAAAKKAGIG